MLKTNRSPGTRGRAFSALAAVCAGGVGIALAVGGVAPAGSADPADPALQSPPTAADAPFTKTVNYLLSQLTPAEEVAVIEKGTDPDPHGEAGYLAGVPRLGIPAVRHADALGINVYADATGWPGRLGLASSFDRAAYSLLGEEVGKQGKALDVDLLYGPQVDMSRYPSWTRNLTTNGEDAYVSAQFAAAEINGIQSQGLMSQVKHVAIYNGQAQTTPSLVSSQAAHEVYLAPAQSAIEDGGVSSLMCSYAIFQIVGEQNSPQYACSNTNLLQNIVKNEFGLKGFITTDYGAGKATSDILAGTDNEFSTSNFSAAKLVPLIDLTSSSFDPAYATATGEAVARVLYEYERFGLLDNSKIPAAYRSDVPQTGDVNSTFNGTAVDKVEGDKVALQLAEESGVLLKNDDATLPLSTDDTVAVVGPTGTLLPSSPGGERSRGFGDQNNNTPLKAMRAVAGTANVVSAPGVDWIGTTVPASALKQDSAGAAAGLTRTTVTSDATPVTTTSVDTVVDGTQTNLVKGYTYTWSGYINVPTSDTYQLLLQRPYGTDSGVATAYNGGVRPASAGTVTLAVDGANKTLAAPSSIILQNDFPDGKVASNGQYLGKDNTGVNLALTPGLHQVSFTYKPSATSAQAPTLRFAWAPLAANTAAAVSAAQTADTTVIYVASDNAGAGPSSSTTAGLAVIPTAQSDLIHAVATAAHAAGHQVAVVLNSGSAVAMPWADEVDAVLEMWYPGEEGGKATANLLYGIVNPSGKLPITFPMDDASTPYSDHPERVTAAATSGSATPAFVWTEGVDVGYRWYTDPAANVNGYEPRYAFGYGLSYTSFDYSGLKVASAADGGLDVTFTVKNTGTVDGADAPQVYLGASPDLAAPVYNADGLVTSGFQQSAQKLVQFDRIELAAGASTTRTLHVDAQSVSAWDTVGQKWVIGSGVRTVSLGASSEDLELAVQKDVPASVVAPAITTNPVANVDATVGQSITLTAAATGTPAPTVQWQTSTDGGTSWSDITGATSASYTFTAAATQSGAQFRAVFVNDLGSVPTSATTLTVALPALSAPAAVAVSPSVVTGATRYVDASAIVSWTASAPTASLAGYDVLDGTKVIASAGPGATSVTVALGSGAHSLTVRANAISASVTGGSVSSAAVAATVDKTGPTAKLTTPKKPTKVASWTKLTGTVKDAGVGASTARISLVEKRAGKFYYYTGTKWVKASSKASALAKATTKAVKVSSSGAWSLSVKALKAGTLVVSLNGTDKLGNASAVKRSNHTIR